MAIWAEAETELPPASRLATTMVHPDVIPGEPRDDERD